MELVARGLTMAFEIWPWRTLAPKLATPPKQFAEFAKRPHAPSALYTEVRLDPRFFGVCDLESAVTQQPASVAIEADQISL